MTGLLQLRPVPSSPTTIFNPRLNLNQNQKFIDPKNFDAEEYVSKKMPTAECISRDGVLVYTDELPSFLPNGDRSLYLDITCSPGGEWVLRSCNRQE